MTSVLSVLAIVLLTLLAVTALDTSELHSLQQGQCQSPMGSHMQDEEDDVSFLQLKNEPDRAVASRLKSIPPIGMVKVHKCASKTLQKIVQSLAITRNMTVMFPLNGLQLGWPQVFPGTENIAKHGPPHHQYEIVASHAIFNKEKWSAYLRHEPVYTMSLREPMDQAISAYNYFKVQKVGDINQTEDYHPRLSRAFPHWGWDSHIAYMQSMPLEVHQDKQNGLFRNPQAYDLGWYEYVGWTAKYDTNVSMINQWLGTLDSSFNQIGGQVLQERFDEGLVLLKRRLKVDIRELSYRRVNAGDYKILPTEEQVQQYRQFLTVDFALYDHFNKTFTKFWEQDEQDNKELLHSLQQANAEYAAFCSRELVNKNSEFCKISGTEYRYELESHWDHVVDALYGCVPPSCLGPL